LGLTDMWRADTIASTYIPQLHGVLGPLFKDAGFPDGVVQVLHLSEGSVARDVEMMIAHKGIRVSRSSRRF
jgi:benzaldehyde dehydrogenase (NAD)